MKSKTIVGLSIALIVSSVIASAQRTSDVQQDSKSGLKIENSPTRGTGYTDTLGTKYGLVYITTTITNDSARPINIKITFLKEYDYPIAYGDHKFNLILWPNLSGDQVTSLLDSMENLMGGLLGKDPDTLHTFSKTIEPGENCVATIGVLRPVLATPCSATPYALFAYSDKENFPSCDWPANENHSSKTQFALGLKVGFCTVGANYESCSFIPCGQISYPEH